MQINALSEILVLTGLILCLTWVFVRIFPPKRINALYGYRTPRSMKNQESWNYAQKLGNRYLIALALVLLLIGTVFLFIDISSWSPEKTFGLSVAILLLGFGVLIFLVEKSLRKAFPKDSGRSTDFN